MQMVGATKSLLENLSWQHKTRMIGAGLAVLALIVLIYVKPAFQIWEY
jgi:hypothetical protein